MQQVHILESQGSEKSLYEDRRVKKLLTSDHVSYLESMPPSTLPAPLPSGIINTVFNSVYETNSYTLESCTKALNTKD